jgi:cell division protein FtsW
MSTARARGRRRDAPGQSTFSEWIENLPRRAEAADARGPAARLFWVVLALSAFGLLVQAGHAATVSTPGGFRSAVMEQAMFRCLGIAVLLGAYRLGPAGARRFLPVLVGLSALMLMAVFVEPFAAAKNGSNRWIELFGVSFQPSELARIVLVLWVADRCVRLGPMVREWRRGVAPILVLVMTFFALVLVETDLGGALLLLFCALSTLWVGGAQLTSMAMTLAALGGGAVTAMTFFIPYVRSRVQIWLGDGVNAQVEGTLAAISSGGLFGVGFGRGPARNLGVPYLESDYVFAQIGEEWGMVGMCLVLALLLAFLWNSLRLVLSIRSRFEALAAFGLLLSVGLQAMLHVQVVAGLAPPKGMTLPFVSDGGTSLVVSSLAVGLALGAARSSSTEH